MTESQKGGDGDSGPEVPPILGLGCLQHVTSTEPEKERMSIKMACGQVWKWCPLLALPANTQNQSHWQI